MRPSLPATKMARLNRTQGTTTARNGLRHIAWERLGFPARALLCALGLGLLGACTNGGDTASLSAPALPLALPGFGIAAPGKPVEVYTRLARLAKACWLSAPAPLSEGYLFTAEVSPEGRGGAASIVIFEKNASPGIPGQRGLVAYSLALMPSGEGTSIGVENGRIAEGFAAKMHADVERWAAGETGCNEASRWPTQAGVGEAGEPAAAAAKPEVKAKGGAKVVPVRVK